MPKQVSNVAVDDYLTAIYRLHHDEGQEPIAARIAERLDVTPPSVAGMLKRLTRNGLVSIDRDKVITLTPEGLWRAKQMVRRHRLAECLLTEVLGVEWWRAYEEAHLLEHGISDITEPALIKALGQPTHSPFGYPIPGIPGAGDGKLSMRTIRDMEDGESSVIDRVFEEDERLLKFFDEEGIRPGAPVEILENAPYRGTVRFTIREHELVMGLEAAQRIWVREN
jgi:DtxR family Mn-dependent transcriptional regulator